MLLTVKLQYGSDIRRITLEEGSNLSVSDLFQRIRAMYTELAEVPSDKLFVKYQDAEGDDIRITNDLEFAEAISSAKEVNNAKLLRLTITFPLQSPGQIGRTSTTASNAPSNNNAVDPLNNILTSALAQLTNNNGQPANSFMPLVQSVLTGAPSGAASGQQQDPLPNLMRNIAASLPAEQVTPIIMNMMQSPAIQQMIPQLLGAFFGAPPQQPKTETASVHTSTVTTSVSSVSTSTPSGEVGMVDATTETAYAVADRSTNTNNVSTATCAISTSTADSPVESVESVGQLNQINMTKSTGSVNEVASIDTTASEPTADSAGSAVVSVASFVGSKFGALLGQLQEFGFTDTEKNIAVLVKHSGDLDKTIDELVANQ